MSVKRQKISIKIDNFKDGTVTLVNESRLSLKAAKQSTNLWQTQDGLWTTRPGTTTYGQAIPNLSTSGTIDGFTQYVTYNTDGTTTTELIVIGGGKAYKSTDGGSWTEITGATFTAGLRCYFLQIKSYLFIANGTDDLAYYNGTALTKYTAIANPAAPTAALTTLTTGAYNNHYVIVTVNNVGMTAASAKVTQTTNKERKNWASGEKITLTLPAMEATAVRRMVYWGDTDGYYYLIGTSTNTTFIDEGRTVDGQAVGALEPNIYATPALDNTTVAPKFTQMELSGNRMWATGDKNNPYRVYWGGTGDYQGWFSPFFGGGSIDLEKGGKNKPTSVVHYRTGKGDSIVTVLCTDPEGNGTTWQIQLTSATSGNVTFSLPMADKIVGSIGSNAPYSVVKAKDAIIFFNSKGFFRLGSTQQLLNLLSTNELSVAVRPNVRSLAGSKSHLVCGYHYLGKILYSVPTSTAGNDQTWIYDTENRNWQLGWTIGFSQFGEYTDSSKNSYLLAAPTTGNQLLKISENVAGDSSQAFNTSFITGLIPVSADRRAFAKIKYAYLELNNPKGTINFKVLGTEKKKGFSQLGTRTITDSVSNTGLSWERLSTTKLSTSTGSPTSFSQSTIKKRIRVNKLLNNVQAQVSSTSLDTKYTILSIQFVGYLVPTSDPQMWTE